MPLNVSEKTVAGEMLRYAQADGIILADGNYDAGWLYDRVEADGDGKRGQATLFRIK